VWLDDDYETALMWQSEQDSMCPGCGFPKDEVWIYSPDEQRRKEDSVEAGMRKCVACSHVDFKAEMHHSNETADKRGIHFVLQRTDDG